MNRKPFVLTLAIALTVVSSGVLLWLPGQAQAPDAAGIAPAAVQAAGRGSPWINLQDGLPVGAAYTGPESAVRTLADGRAEPLSLASADFDGDGTDDLAIGYADAAGGLLVVQAGNPDFMYPDSPIAAAHRATGTFVAEPFLPAAAVFAVPARPDFLASGDFDADGRQDVALAAREGAALYFLQGDGRGDFGLPKIMPLPGAVTALAVGEVNRRDGLANIAVGVNSADIGYSVLVLEGPEGAQRAEPEAFTLPAAATGLALAALDDDPYYDLAIAAGKELVLVRGRDRWLALPDGMRPPVAPAQVERQALPFAVLSLAAGDFVWSEAYRLELALLADDGVLRLLDSKDLDHEDTKEGEAQDHEDTKEREAHEARSREEISSQHGSFATFALRVLREPSRFRDPNGRRDPNALRPPSLLTSRVSFAAVDTVTVLDPASQQIHIAVIAPGAQGTISNTQYLTSLDAASAPVAVLPLRLNLDAMSDLVILQRGAPQPVVVLTAPTVSVMVNSTGNEPDACPREPMCDTAYRPRCPAPPAAPPCTCSPDYEIPPSGLCTLHAALDTAAAFPGSAINFSLSAGSVIRPDDMLRTPTGTSIIGSAGGPPWVLIDGSALGPGAVIFYQDWLSGNSTYSGLIVSGGKSSGFGLNTSNGNVFVGNYIGTDATGTQPFGNGFGGIDISGGSNNRIGDGSPAGRNVIAANKEFGIRLAYGATDNQVRGNWIGVAADGRALSNGGSGVELEGASSTIVAGNLISNNSRYGVEITPYTPRWNAVSNLVQGNLIGTDTAGVEDQGNRRGGVAIFYPEANTNTIGGTAAGMGNLISGNDQNGGIYLGLGATRNTIQGNLIGVMATGGAALANNGPGIYISASPDNTIGGARAGDACTGPCNLISGNQYSGIEIQGSASVQNRILGNFIGTNLAGQGAVGNSAGISISGAERTTIGGVTVAQASTVPGNLISGNRGSGLALSSGANRSIVEGNRIGSDRQGQVALGNQGRGLSVGSDNNTIQANLVVGNAGGGALGNGGDGVYIQGEGNRIGDGDPTQGNVIARNTGNGVLVASGAGNAILGNSIYANTLAGIDLGGNGWSRNDSGDGDGGANNLQNFPALTAITSAGGATIVTGTLHSAANTNYRIEFFTPEYCDPTGLIQGKTYVGFLNVATDANGDAPFIFTFPGSGIYATATATRLDGGEPRDTSEFAPPDIQVVGAEVTQAIQDMDNTAPLVEDKPTTARVYIQAQGCHVPNVTAELRGPRGTAKLLNSPIRAEALPDPRPTSSERLYPDTKSLNFAPGIDWQQGTSTWQAEVNPGCIRPDAECGGANIFQVQNLTFHQTQPLTLAFAPIRYTHGGTDLTPTEAELKGLANALFKLYPISRRSVEAHITKSPLVWDEDLTTEAGWSDLLNRLWWFNFWTTDPGPNTHWYGVVDDRVPVGQGGVGILGMGYWDGSEAIGRLSAGGDVTLAHELSHNLGRLHPGCEPNEGDPDPTWPKTYSPCHLAVNVHDGYWGFDPTTNKDVYAPDARADFMTYRRPSWVSEHTYKGLFARLTGSTAQVATSAAPANGDYLALSGSIILTNDAVTLDTIWRTTEPGVPYTPRAGPYTLELRDAGDQVLITHMFDLRDLDQPAGAERGYFVEVLPYHASAARILLEHNGVELASRIVSPHAPTVAIVYPNGGESLTGTVTVRWTAADADGDPLRYVVQYSRDAGTTWQAVALDLAETSLQLDTGQLPGGEQCLFRVWASDGVNTGQDRSDAVFSVPRKPPQAVIVQPKDGAVLTPGYPLIPWGLGLDPEEGTLGDAALSWTDSVSGTLGAGAEIELPNGLAPGWHTVMLTVTDSDGMTSADSVTVYVGQLSRLWLPLVRKDLQQ